MIREECRAHISRLAYCFRRGAEGARAYYERESSVNVCCKMEGCGFEVRLTIGSRINGTSV